MQMDAPLALTHSACNQQSEEQYEIDARYYTSQALAELYGQIQAMPDCKQKQQLLKKFTSEHTVFKSSRPMSAGSGSLSTPPQTPHATTGTRGSVQATPLSAVS